MKFLKNKRTILLLVAGIFFIAFIQIFRIKIRELNPYELLANTLLHPYLSFAEYIANKFIKLIVDGVNIQEHKIIFTSYPEYFQKNKAFIEDWIPYILNLKWSAVLFVSFWLPQSSLKKKIRFTFFLVITHFLAVVGGLVLLAGIGPKFFNSNAQFQLRPNIIGIITNFSLFAIWVKSSQTDIKLGLQKINIKISLSDKKITEILIVFFIIILLKYFLIPFFSYDQYIGFISRAIKSFVFLFGYQTEITGPLLTGPNGGTLYIDKVCLGFISMFIFAALVFLTRRDNKTAWKYIISGIIILHFLNIVRLSYLLMYVQHNSDVELIMEHHDMYNIVFYIFIFILWIIWFEKFNKEQKKVTEI